MHNDIYFSLQEQKESLEELFLEAKAKLLSKETDVILPKTPAVKRRGKKKQLPQIVEDNKENSETTPPVRGRGRAASRVRQFCVLGIRASAVLTVFAF